MQYYSDENASLNKQFDSASVSSFTREYAETLKASILNIDSQELQNTLEVLQNCQINGKKIYAVGNGGSAAICSHLACDLAKGTAKDGKKLIVFSLSDKVSLLSALNNDIGHQKSYEWLVDHYVEKNDVLIAISSSGNSENILRSVEAAKKRGATTIGFSGFSGGKLKHMADINITIDCENYGIVEDGHQAVFHILAQYLFANN